MKIHETIRFLEGCCENHGLEWDHARLHVEKALLALVAAHLRHTGRLEVRIDREAGELAFLHEGHPIALEMLGRLLTPASVKHAIHQALQEALRESGQ